VYGREGWDTATNVLQGGAAILALMREQAT